MELSIGKENSLMKKRLVFLLCLAAFAALFTVSALAATEGDYEYTVTDGAATITKYTGPGGDVAIPSELGGYPGCFNYRL